MAISVSSIDFYKRGVPDLVINLMELLPSVGSGQSDMDESRWRYETNQWCNVIYGIYITCFTYYPLATPWGGYWDGWWRWIPQYQQQLMRFFSSSSTSATSTRSKAVVLVLAAEHLFTDWLILRWKGIYWWSWAELSRQFRQSRVESEWVDVYIKMNDTRAGTARCYRNVTEYHDKTL